MLLGDYYTQKCINTGCSIGFQHFKNGVTFFSCLFLEDPTIFIIHFGFFRSKILCLDNAIFQFCKKSNGPPSKIRIFLSFPLFYFEMVLLRRKLDFIVYMKVNSIRLSFDLAVSWFKQPLIHFPKGSNALKAWKSINWIRLRLIDQHSAGS